MANQPISINSGLAQNSASAYRIKRRKMMSLTTSALAIKGKLLRLSLAKLSQIIDPEMTLRRCVLIYNAAKALKGEILLLEERRFLLHQCQHFNNYSHTPLFGNTKSHNINNASSNNYYYYQNVYPQVMQYLDEKNQAYNNSQSVTYADTSGDTKDKVNNAVNGDRIISLKTSCHNAKFVCNLNVNAKRPSTPIPMSELKYQYKQKLPSIMAPLLYQHHHIKGKASYNCNSLLIDSPDCHKMLVDDVYRSTKHSNDNKTLISVLNNKKIIINKRKHDHICEKLCTAESPIYHHLSSLKRTKGDNHFSKDVKCDNHCL